MGCIFLRKEEVVDAGKRKDEQYVFENLYEQPA